MLGQEISSAWATASFTGKMKQAWRLRTKRCLHSVPMSMVGKDTKPLIHRVFLVAASGGQRLLKDTCRYSPAQPLAPQIQVMLEFRESWQPSL